MIFVDTAYLVAVANVRDALHPRAAAWAAVVGERLLVTEYVMIEVLNHFSDGKMRARGVELMQSVQTDPAFQYLDAEKALLEKGLSVYRRARDKDWSLTDCVSFEVMREHRISQALTHDHHFEQAGFDALLRRDPPSA